MRGRLKEQDLTDYALNELPPDERLYVESMLGVSDECRNDVYQMLELGEMLKEGFDPGFVGEALALSDEQRAKVLDVPEWNWRGAFQKVAAILLLSVGTAFMVTRPGFWTAAGRSVGGEQLASAGQAVQGMVADVQEKGFARTVEEFRSRLEKLSSEAAAPEWQFASQPAVCTPPVWLDLDLPEIADM
jgi:anti-sigma factor RsiW